MLIKINCIYNNRGAWCVNKNIKRSLFGIGARCCIEYPYKNDICPYQKKYKKPPPPKKQFT
jgi:hypothetical protein